MSARNFAGLPQYDCRSRDGRCGDREWQDGGIEVRMNQEQASSDGTDEQGDKHAH
jgi:hypothetical protein